MALLSSPLPAGAADTGEADVGDMGELFASLEAIDKMTMADILKGETAVASNVKQTLRDSPAILTVMTRDQIASLGARDLMEILEHVPGFQFASDVQGAVGAGFRGLWGHEGKVLLLVDGHEMNELLYLTTQFGQHIPADLVEKVEIIRGPGSVIYGGYAELAVINVITRGAEQLKGVAASTTLAAAGEDYSRRGASLAWGQVYEEQELSVSGTAHLGQGRRSDGTYADLAGNAFPMSASSGIEPALVGLNARWKGLSASFLYDGYRLQDRTGFGENLPAPGVWQGFGSWHFRASYEVKPFAGLTLTPQLKFKRHSPWAVLEKEQAESRDAVYYDKSADRFVGGLQVRWEPIEKVSVLLGGEGQHDSARINDPGRLCVELSGPDALTCEGRENYRGLNAPWGDAPSVSYWNVAGYAQVLWDSPWASLSAGARAESHEVFGASFVPRAALTRTIGDFHVKALASAAFKAPGIENLRINEALEPERTRVFELEGGYLLGERHFLSVNLFDLRIDGPIVYTAVDGEETYANSSPMGSRGVEAELSAKYPRASGKLTYSYYLATGDQEVPMFQAPGRTSTYLGFASHKVTLAGSVEALSRLFVSPSLVFLGRRWAVTGLDALGKSRYEYVSPLWLAGLDVTYKGPALKGLEIGAGVRNLLNQRALYYQPYDGGHAPLPGLSREFIVHLAYATP